MSYGLKMIKCGLVAALIGLTDGVEYDVNGNMTGLHRGDIVKRKTEHGPAIEYKVVRRVRLGSNVYKLESTNPARKKQRPELALKSLELVKSAKDVKKDEKLQAKLDSATPSIEYLAKYMGVHFPPSKVTETGHIVIYQNRKDGKLIGKPMLGSVTRIKYIGYKLQKKKRTESGIVFEIMAPAWIVFVEEWKNSITKKAITFKVDGHIKSPNHGTGPKLLAVVPTTEQLKRLPSRFSPTEYENVIEQLTAILRQAQMGHFVTHDFKGDADKKRAKNEKTFNKYYEEATKICDEMLTNLESEIQCTTPSTGSSSNMSICEPASDVESDAQSEQSPYHRINAIEFPNSIWN